MGTVLLVDDDVDVCEAMVDLIGISCGWECVTFGSLAELSAARERALGCDVAILDIFAGRIVFLTGHAGADPRRAASLAAGSVFAKPIGLDTLRDALSRRAA